MPEHIAELTPDRYPDKEKVALCELRGQHILKVGDPSLTCTVCGIGVEAMGTLFEDEFARYTK